MKEEKSLFDNRLISLNFLGQENSENMKYSQNYSNYFTFFFSVKQFAVFSAASTVFTSEHRVADLPLQQLFCTDTQIQRRGTSRISCYLFLAFSARTSIRAVLTLPYSSESPVFLNLCETAAR